MKKVLPVVVHGDGTSVWTLTHHKDFAVGFVGLLGNPATINEAFHITSDEWLSWNNIYTILVGELCVEPHLIHIPSTVIARYDKEIGDGLLGDKTHSMIFDNSKIKRFVLDFNPQISFRQGAKEIVKWYEENEMPQQFDKRINSMMDQIIQDFAPFLTKEPVQSMS